jgi:hypothetical protein
MKYKFNGVTKDMGSAFIEDVLIVLVSVVLGIPALVIAAIGAVICFVFVVAVAVILGIAGILLSAANVILDSVT